MPLSSVDEFIDKHRIHGDLLNSIRAMILTFPLEEHIKWSAPVYSYKGINLVSFNVFKHHSGLWFFQGALIDDSFGVLQNSQEGKTVAMRHYRIEHGESPDLKLLKNYIRQSIDNIEQGKTIQKKKSKKLKPPAILTDELKKNQPFLERFEELSLAKRNEYIDYLNEAKLDSTRIKRLEKMIHMVLKGKGLNDKYRK
jgi:uncharacterized protein YdeI (YjbR/CyaY-like superfamily)